MDSIARPTSASAFTRCEPLLRSVMNCRTQSAANRRLAKDIVWGWMGSRWPQLRPSETGSDRSHIESATARGRLEVSTTPDGAIWRLTVATRERDDAPVWSTLAVVADTPEGDVLALETSCSDVGAAPVVAPPAVLGHWVERIQLDDDGVPIKGEPHHARDDSEARALFEHVTGERRKLPVVLLAAKGESRYYGVEPRMLAQALRGLAHVALLAAPALQAWVRLCGREFSPAPGTARIYAPGCGRASESHMHPPAAVSLLTPGNFEADGKRSATQLRHRIRRQVCALSVAASASTVALTRFRSTLPVAFSGSESTK